MDRSQGFLKLRRRHLHPQRAHPGGRDLAVARAGGDVKLHFGGVDAALLGKEYETFQRDRNLDRYDPGAFVVRGTWRPDSESEAEGVVVEPEQQGGVGTVGEPRVARPVEVAGAVANSSTAATDLDL